ncbi:MULTISPECIES: hypothetical protein [unclassified Streptomyces]|uniref:Uncharacterized protein n=1 Tax=Streptomyces sp. NBC_00060 TaxID=2975636 RepID=A0AAU2GQH1_9ACTN
MLVPCKGVRPGAAAAGAHIGETVDVPGGHAPSQYDAIKAHDLNEFLVLDSTRFRTDCIAAPEPYCWQKAAGHGRLSAQR